jgi:plastocyanin
MVKQIKRAVVLIVVAGVMLAPSALGDTFRVRATANNRWNPDFKHITRGDRIAWKNPAKHNTVHNVKAYSNNWNKFETLSPGEVTRKRFRKNGTYKYRCTLHSTMNNGDCNGMCGVIHVQGS